MRIFIIKIIILGIIVSAAAFMLSSIPGLRYDFKNGETESNLFLIASDKHYDIVILGTSHGKIFSRYGNHDRVENILGKSVMNLSIGSGRGIYAAKIYLDYFLGRNNTADTVIYFIDPWVFYSDKWNEENDLFAEEPLKPDFLALIIRKKVNAATILNYIKANVSWGWISKTPGAGTENTIALQTADKDAVIKRIKSLYPDGLDEMQFRKYKEELYGLIELAESKNMRLIFVIPSTLLGDMPGEDELKTAISAKESELHDLSDAITDPQLYSDHDHLNSKGVTIFTEKYLAPLFSDQ